MRKLITLLLFIGLAILAYTTNPSVDRHREAVAEKVAGYVEEYKKENPFVESILGSNSGELSFMESVLLKEFTRQTVTSKDYKLFSTTEITWEGKKHTIGVGAFGRVFFSGRMDDEMDRIVEGVSKQIPLK